MTVMNVCKRHTFVRYLTQWGLYLGYFGIILAIEIKKYL